MASLSDILLQSQNPQTVQQAYQLLEEYKEGTTNYLGELLQLLYVSDQKVAFIAATQAANILKKYLDMDEQELLDLTQSLINSYDTMSELARRHMSNVISEIAAHLFFTTVYNPLPNRIAQLLSASPDNVELFIDYYRIVERLYTHNAGRMLNDRIAEELLILLKHTQSIPLQINEYIQQQSPKNQIILYQISSSIIASAYSWEDLPDYFEENLVQTMQELMSLLQLTGTSQPELQIEENCLKVIFNIVSNHFNDIEEEYQDSLINALVQYIKLKNNDQREYLISETLNNLTRWYQSPELGEELETKYCEDLVGVSVEMLEVTPQSIENAATMDCQFVLSEITNHDELSRSHAAEQLISVAKNYNKELEALIERQINNLPLFETIQLFRILVIKSRSLTFGIQLELEYVQLVSQYLLAIFRQGATAIGGQNLIVQSHTVRLLDFYPFAEDAVQLLQVKVLSELVAAPGFHDFPLVIATATLNSLLRYLLKQRTEEQAVQKLLPLVCEIHMRVCTKMTDNYQNDQLIIHISQIMQLLASRNVPPQEFAADVTSAFSDLFKLELNYGNQEVNKNVAHAILALLAYESDNYRQKLMAELVQILAASSTESVIDNFMFISQIVVLIENQMGTGDAAVKTVISNLFSCCISAENHRTYPELSEVFFVVVCNILRSGRFTDGPFCHVSIQLQAPRDESGPAQSEVLLELINQTVQIQSNASFAYECLNLLMELNIQLDAQNLVNICEYNFRRVKELYNNRELLKYVTIFYCYLFQTQDIVSFFEQCEIPLCDLLDEVILIGCQSAFSFRDKNKSFLCDALLKVYQTNNELHGPVKKCIASLLGRLRNRPNLVTQERVQMATVSCLLDGITSFEVQDSSPEDVKQLEQRCLGALGIENWL